MVKKLRKILFHFGLEVRRLLSLVLYLYSDVIIFGYGSTAFSTHSVRISSQSGWFTRKLRRSWITYAQHVQKLELLVLRRTRSRMLVLYQGDDARQGDRSLEMFETCVAQRVTDPYYTPESDEQKRIEIDNLTGLCDYVFAFNPDLLNFLPRKAMFLPYAHISIRDWTPEPIGANQSILRVAHAPTHRAAKGTACIISAIEELKSEGFAIDLDLIENVPILEARQRYLSCDLFVDQLYAGWYGSVAVELMALSKPVIAYIRETDLSYIPSQMADDLPVLRADDATLKETLRSCLTHYRCQLRNVGLMSRRYIETWHNDAVINSQLKNVILNGL